MTLNLLALWPKHKIEMQIIYDGRKVQVWEFVSQGLNIGKWSTGKHCDGVAFVKKKWKLLCQEGGTFPNPRPTGGEGLFRAPPPLVFLRYLLNRCRYHRQTCSTLSPNIFTHCVKILKSRVSYFGHKWRQSDVMFRRFRAKIRVYRNRRHGCSFKATINFSIWNDVELVGLQNCYLGVWKFWKFLKIFKIFDNFFSFSTFSPSKSKFSKNRTIC